MSGLAERRLEDEALVDVRRELATEVSEVRDTVEGFGKEIRALLKEKRRQGQGFERRLADL